MKPDRYILHAMAITLAIALVPLSGMQPARAEDSDSAALRLQVEELQHTVKALQQQVKELQAQNPSSSSAATTPARTETPAPNNTPRIRGYIRPDLVSSSPPGTPAAKTSLTPETIREHWHSLERGMTDHTVNGLLGAPTRSFKLNNKLVWYYDYEEVGRGSVMFSEDGLVTDWQAPPKSHWFW